MESLILLVLALTTSAIAASNCSINPIYVDFHDRCVDNCFTVQYGLFIGIGNPFQNESLWPSLSNNETTVAGVDYCGEGTSDNCVNQTHGFYSPGQSTSFQSFSGGEYTSLDSTSSLATIEQFGTDRLNIYTHYFDPSPPNVTHVDNFPLYIFSNYSSPQSPWFGPAGLLGLGPSSTVLTMLHDADLISSRSFGLYVGTAYPRAGGAINGSLTLGGYDSGRFTGEAVHYDLSTPPADSPDATPYRVSVASISLIDAATNTSTILSDSAFDAYLTTSQFEVTLPDTITNSFMETTSATAASDDLISSMSPNIPAPLALPPGFEGALTITLTSGQTVTLDTISGSLRNTSNLTPLSAPSSNNTSRVPLLGTSLLAHLYLTTNFDSQPPSFHLSPAAPHGPYVITSPLCPNDTPEAYISPSISSFSRNGTIGAILGGVIGGIGVTFAVWWLIRKWFQQREKRRWEIMYGGDDDAGSAGKGKGVESSQSYDVDEEGLKVLASAAAGTRTKSREGGKRGKLRGILKKTTPSRNTERSTSEGAKRSLSSSGSDEEEGYDMAHLQSSVPVGSTVAGGMHQHQQQYQQPPTNDEVGNNWPLAYPQYGQQQQQQQQAGLMRGRSTSPSRSRSPSPIFSPDHSQPVSTGTARNFPQPVSSSSFSNIPLSPQSHSYTNSQPHQSQPQHSTSLHPLTLSQHYSLSQTHKRSNSEETRRQLNLKVNTYFDAPPSKYDRVGKKFRGDKGWIIKQKDTIVRKPGSEEHGILRKIFPSN